MNLKSDGFYFFSHLFIKVLDLSASDDAEALLISKMKQACGYEYTNKLQNMYQDIAVSKNLADKFQQKNETSEVSLKTVFRVKVLTNGCWPLANDINVNLPIELTPIIDRFMAFYHNEHTGRKLMWLHKLSKTELIMNGLMQRYHIKVRSKSSITVIILCLSQLKVTIAKNGTCSVSFYRQIHFKRLCYFITMISQCLRFNSLSNIPAWNKTI